MKLLESNRKKISVNLNISQIQHRKSTIPFKDTNKRMKRKATN